MCALPVVNNGCIGVQGMADLTIWKTIYDYLDRRMLKDLLASKMQH